MTRKRSHRQDGKAGGLSTGFSTRFSMRFSMRFRRRLAMVAGGLVVVAACVTIRHWWGADSADVERWLWVHPLPNYRIGHDQLWVLLERFNDVLRRVGREADVAVVELARNTPKSTEFFYDDDHFNVAGAKLIADAIAEACLATEEISRRLAP